MQNGLKGEFGGVGERGGGREFVADTQTRAEERHFWRNDKPNMPPKPKERNHKLAWDACRNTHCYVSLMCPSTKLCVYIVLYLNKL